MCPFQTLRQVASAKIWRRYMSFGLVAAEMEVGAKFLQILQTEFVPA